MVGGEPPAEGSAGLDAKTAALVLLAALVAQGGVRELPGGGRPCAGSRSDRRRRDRALRALQPVVGTVRLKSAVPDVALALGAISTSLADSEAATDGSSARARPADGGAGAAGGGDGAGGVARVIPTVRGPGPAAGASDDDLVGTIHAVAPIVGVPRIVAAAPDWRSRSATTSTRRSRRPTAPDPPSEVSS